MSSVTPTVEVSKRDRASLERSLRDIPKGADKAMSGAIAKTARPLETLVRRTTAKNLGVSQKALREERSVATRYARKNGFRTGATVSVTGRRLALKRFSPRQTRRGVSYKSKGGTRAKISSAFVASKLGDHVFTRKTDARLPIRKLYGPSAPHAAISDPTITRYVREDLPVALTRQIDNQVARIIEKQGGRS